MTGSIFENKVEVLDSLEWYPSGIEGGSTHTFTSLVHGYSMLSHLMVAFPALFWHKINGVQVAHWQTLLNRKRLDIRRTIQIVKPCLKGSMEER